MICKVCHGSGNLIQFAPMVWWTCPCCGGAGVSIMSITKPTIAIGKHQMKIKQRKNNP